MKKSTNYDAIILGGALTGTVLYIALAEIFVKHNKSLIILERESRPIPDTRMLSLGYAGGELLRKFGLWDELEQHICPVSSLSINYSNHKSSGSMNGKNSMMVEARDLGLPALGWTIPHQKLQSVLWDKVRQLQKQHSNLTEVVPFNMESIDLIDQGEIYKGEPSAIITGGDIKGGDIKGGERTLSGKLVFAATGTVPLPWGASGGVIAGGKKNVDLSQNRISYNYYGKDKDTTSEQRPAFVVASVKISNHKQGQGYWFGGTSATALALTPSANKSANSSSDNSANESAKFSTNSTDNSNSSNKSSVYVAIASLPHKPEQLDKEEFARLLQEIIRDSELTIESIEESPAIYQASSYIAKDRVVGPVVLIGNAAHSVAPLGGQNYNMTLWTLDKLRDCISDHLYSGNDFTNREFLMDYVTQTDPEIRRGLGLVHHIDDLLSGRETQDQAFDDYSLTNIFNKLLPPEVLVNYFMQTMSYVPAVRNKIFARAAGMHRLD